VLCLFQPTQTNNPNYYKYLDKAFSSFSHNLQIVGNVKQGQIKKFQSSWTYKDQEIKTEFKVKYPAIEHSILYSCLIGEHACDKSELITFNLPPEEKRSPLSSNANVEEMWNCLINKYPAYEDLYTPSEEFNDKGFLILNQKQAGYCQVCEKEHESVGA